MGNRPGRVAGSQTVYGLEYHPKMFRLCSTGNGESSKAFVYDQYSSLEILLRGHIIMDHIQPLIARIPGDARIVLSKLFHIRVYVEVIPVEHPGLNG